MNGGDQSKKLFIAGTRGRREGTGVLKEEEEAETRGVVVSSFGEIGMSVVLSRRLLSSLSQLGKRKAFGFFDGSYANPSAARFLSTTTGSRRG
ncbi:hypothetical protein V6N13_001030 [Hibiscus sabdariffa]